MTKLGDTNSQTDMASTADLVGYVKLAGDNMTGNLGFGVASPSAKIALAVDTTPAGGISFGADTNLYRSAPDTLTTDDFFFANPAATDLVTGQGIYNVSTYNYTAVNTGVSALYAGRFTATKTGSDTVNGVLIGLRAVGNNVSGAANAVRGLVTSVVTGGNTGFATGVQIATASGGGTVGTAMGIEVLPQGKAGTTKATGVQIAAQTGATENHGMTIDAASTTTLWLSANANNTTPSAGITFGLARDTNLYRSAASTLATDGNLKVGTSATNTLGFYGAAGAVRPTLPAAATDATTTMALANAIRTALLATGYAA